MRRITIVGAGQSGLQLGIGLAQAGYDVTCVSNRTPEPPPHVLDLLGAACESPKIARRFANGFDDPSDFQAWFMTPEAARAYLDEIAAAPAAPRRPER